MIMTKMLNIFIYAVFYLNKIKNAQHLLSYPHLYSYPIVAIKHEKRLKRMSCYFFLPLFKITLRIILVKQENLKKITTLKL